MFAEGEIGRADRLQRDLGEHLLGEPHQVLVVHVRLVELQHRELGVVLRRDALVAEVAVDLVDALDAADDEPLEVELRRDAHVQLHVERVVMRDERPRQRAAGDRLHHRRLDFEEAACVEEAANGRERARAHVEDAARVGIDDQVEVALAVAGLDVLEAVPLLRQRQEALGEERQRRRPDGQLVGPRPEQATLDAHLVAEIEQLEHRERLGADRVLSDVDLQRRRAVRQHQEVRLAERAKSEDPPRGPHGHVFGLERLTRVLAVRRDDVADAVRGVVGVGIRPDAEGEQFLVVGAALRDEFGIGHWVRLGVAGLGLRAQRALWNRCDDQLRPWRCYAIGLTLRFGLDFSGMSAGLGRAVAFGDGSGCPVPGARSCSSRLRIASRTPLTKPDGIGSAEGPREFDAPR